MLSKDIHSNLLINGNRRVLVEIYVIASRRFKDEIKTKINFEKLLRIIISI
jgi:hypothetical protein